MPVRKYRYYRRASENGAEASRAVPTFLTKFRTPCPPQAGVFSASWQTPRFPKLVPLVGTALVEVAPIGAGADFRHHRNRELVGAFHLLADKFFQGGTFFDGGFEQEFVMNL